MVGHDWGGGVAWYLAIKHPELVEKLIVCNIPHPETIFQAAERTLSQLKKSW